MNKGKQINKISFKSDFILAINFRDNQKIVEYEDDIKTKLTYVHLMLLQSK